MAISSYQSSCPTPASSPFHESPAKAHHTPPGVSNTLPSPGRPTPNSHSNPSNNLYLLCIAAEIKNATPVNKTPHLPSSPLAYPEFLQQGYTKPPIPSTTVKGPWSPEEDKILIAMVGQHGPRKWSKIASRIPGRTGKQARERWLNQLSPKLRKGPWTNREDQILLKAHKRWGNCWSKIAAELLPGRSDNACKNRWNTLIRTRLSAGKKHWKLEAAVDLV